MKTINDSVFVMKGSMAGTLLHRTRPREKLPR